MHALLFRSWKKRIKGRDWYDLLWYRSHRPPIEPNIVLLENALDQTTGSGKANASKWKDELLKIVESIDTGKMAKDIRPFLEYRNDADMLTISGIKTILR